MNNEMLKFVENDRFARFIGIKLINVESGYAIAKIEITFDEDNTIIANLSSTGFIKR